jgi:hypothetical protein
MADAQDVYIDPAAVTNKYVVTGKMWMNSPIGKMAWRHGMGRMESADFIHWTNVEYILSTDDRDDRTTNFPFSTGYEKYVNTNNATNGGYYTNYTYTATNMPAWDGHNLKFHTSPVFPYEGLYLSFNQLYYQPEFTDLRSDNDEILEVELMSSRDGRHWNRFRYEDNGVRVLPRGSHDRVSSLPTYTNDPNHTGTRWILDNISVTNDPAFPGVTNAVRDEFDSKGIVTTGPPIIEPREMRVYYAAVGSGGVGMARVGRDRLVGVASVYPSGGNKVGQVTLKPMNLSGYGNIAVNAIASGTTSAQGSVQVELLNSAGRPIPGYTKALSVPLVGDPALSSTNATNSVSGDPLSLKVSWTGTTGLPQDNCQIRVHLFNAELFSVSLEP